MVRNALNFTKIFLKKRDAFTADEILGHNLEDVLGLGRIFDMLGYLCIYDGDYEVTYSEFDGDNPVSYTHLDVYKRQRIDLAEAPFPIIISIA